MFKSIFKILLISSLLTACLKPYPFDKEEAECIKGGKGGWYPNCCDYELYRKLINDPIYRGNGTFENFAVNLTDKEKFSMIKLIENLCKNDEIFNNEEKITSYFNIQWVENSKLNSAIKQELGIISYEYDNRTN